MHTLLIKEAAQICNKLFKACHSGKGRWVEFLVKQGFRRIAFFQYLYPNLMEHWLLIQHDFDRVAREFQLRNPDLEVFVKEHGWDCSAFLDFWQHEPQLPEVIVRIGKEANDLKAEMAKRSNEDFVVNKGIKIARPKPSNYLEKTARLTHIIY